MLACAKQSKTGQAASVENRRLAAQNKQIQLVIACLSFVVVTKFVPIARVLVSFSVGCSEANSKTKSSPPRKKEDRWIDPIWHYRVWFSGENDEQESDREKWEGEEREWHSKLRNWRMYMILSNKQIVVNVYSERSPSKVGDDYFIEMK